MLNWHNFQLRTVLIQLISRSRFSGSGQDNLTPRKGREERKKEREKGRDGGKEKNQVIE